MKHFFLKAVLLTALSITLVGCGKTAEGVTETVGENNSQNEKTITIVRIASDGVDPKEAETKINEYLADKFDYHITIREFAEADYEDEARKVLDNNLAALVQIDGAQGRMGINSLVKEGKLTDITELLSETDLYNSLNAEEWDKTKVSGKNYYVPVTGEQSEGYSLIFRKAATTELGWNNGSVKNIADLDKMFAEAKENEQEAVFLTGNTALFSALYLDNYDFFIDGADWIAFDRKAGVVTDTIMTKEYKQFCKRMSDWAEEGFLSENEAAKETSDNAIEGSGWTVSWCDSNKDADQYVGQETVAVAVTGNYYDTNTGLKTAYGVSANSSEKEAKAIIKLLGMVKNDSELYSLFANNAATNTDAEDSIIKGFVFDISPVASQYEACKKVFDEYGYVLENGGYSSTDIDSVLEHYQTAMNEAGYQDILAEAKNQYELWKNPPVIEVTEEGVSEN